MDNSVYGMTKGQASPTTEPDWMGSKLTPEGTGVAPFRPLEIALSAGANFIARAFSGKPQDLTHMIATAVAHPGFSFIHVLSPCVTFRPEQRAYKHLTHPAFTPTHSRTAAFQTLLEDDGMGTGILYQGHAPAFQSPSHSSHTLAALKQQFVV
jgi:2-oxoglutarate ferredoxin oxidoreductase subunit beta